MYQQSLPLRAVLGKRELAIMSGSGELLLHCSKGRFRPLSDCRDSTLSCSSLSAKAVMQDNAEPSSGRTVAPRRQSACGLTVRDERRSVDWLVWTSVVVGGEMLRRTILALSFAIAAIPQWFGE